MTKQNFANFQKYAAMDGVSLLLVPSGQFGGQELPTDAEIKAFVKEQNLDKPNVHVLSKGDVRAQPLKLPGKPADGPAGNPRAAWKAMQAEAGANEPGWNFGTHFVISKSGKVSTAKPKELEAALQAALKE
jgi:glutathione peroxidase-family protein